MADELFRGCQFNVDFYVSDRKSLLVICICLSWSCRVFGVFLTGGNFCFH